jgi:tetratricopeptide (TPR) repeat protein
MSTTAWPSWMMARKTYTKALRFVQQANADRSWNVHILQRMADIDMQKLDWKQAIRVYEQIRTLRPDDEGMRKNLIELSLRLGQPAQANAELENYLTYLQTSGRSGQGIKFIEELLQERPDDLMLPSTCPAISASRASRRCCCPARLDRRFVPERGTQGGGDRHDQPDPADEPAIRRTISSAVDAAAILLIIRSPQKRRAFYSP